MRNATVVLPHLFSKRVLTVFATLALAEMTAASALAGNDENEFTFNMVRSGVVVSSNVLPHARARVRIESVGPVEIMNVTVFGLPPNTDFDFFVIQRPVAPFGLSWYQGDIETNRFGVGFGSFVGRFSIETFIVAPLATVTVNGLPPGVAPAPTPHQTDASSNPPTSPVHTYHLGLWFNSPQDAQKAGLPNTVTPFNGEHNAGVQVLNTSNFPDLEGPLINVGQ
jgi:hypothetical protein